MKKILNARFVESLVERYVVAVCPVRSLVACLLAVAFVGAGDLQASTAYWDGTGGSWNTLIGWSTNPSDATPDPSSVPGSSDTAFFNISTVSGLQSLTLDAPQAVTKLALVGSASGGVSLLGGGTDRVLSLGSGGIESADGAGPLTLGSTVGGQGVPIALTANQTWTNGSASPVTVNNAISAAGVQTLTLRGPGSFRLNGTNTFNGGIITGSGVFLYIGNESALGGGTLTANGGRFYVEDFPLVITNKFKMNNTPLSWWGDGSVTLAGIASSPAVAITVNANQPFTINRTAPTLITGIWSMSDSASGLNNSGVGVTLSSGANVRYTGDIRENNSGNASGVSNYGIYFSFNGAGSDLTLYGNNLYGDGASKGTSINVNAKAGYNSLSIGGPGGPGAVITPLGVATLYSNYGRGIFLKALVSGQCITNNIRMDASTDNDGGMPFGFDGENDLTLGGTILPAKTVNFPNLANATLTVTGGVNCGSVKLTFQGPGHTAFSAPSLLSGTSGGIGKSGPGTLTLAGTSTYLGSTTLYGGTAILDYSEASVSRLAPSTNAASGLTLGGVDLQLKGGSYAQTLGDGAGTTISQGHSRIRRTNGGTSTLALGALTRATNAGGVVDFESGVASTTTGNAVGILGGYGFYTVDNTDWATGGGTISALASYDSFAVPGTDKNILLTGTGSTAGTTVNTLKILTTGSEQSLTITSGTLLLSRSGLLFTGADDYTITGGTLRGRAGYQGDLVVHQNGSGVLTIASSLGNDNNSYFVKAGEGTVVLTYTNNTYIGGTYLLKGVLSVSEEKNLGPGTLTVNGGTLRSTAGFTLSRAISLSSNGGTFDVTTGTLELSGVIASGYGALNKTGPGTLLLTGNNTYNGPTTVTEGTLKLGHDRGLGSASTNANRSVSPVFVKNGATLDIAGCSAYIGNFTLNNGTVADSVGNGVLGAYSFVVNTGLVNVALADVTSPNTANTFNSVNLFKRSSGTVTLTASNLYSGTTFVEAGDLVVNGTLAASPVIVQSAGTLRGTGTLQRTINVEGGTLAPGTSASLPGTLTLGRHLRLDSTATLSIGIGGAGSGKIVLSNPDAKVLLANASLSLSMLPGAVSALTVIDNQGGNPIQGTFSGLPEGATFDAGGRRFAITYSGGDGNDVALTFKPTATLILFN